MKFVNFVATRGKIFSLKFTKYRLAAGLRPDPLGKLKRSPDPLAAIRGPTSKGRGRERGGRGREGERKGTWMEGERDGRGREGGLCSSNISLKKALNRNVVKIAIFGLTH